MDHNQNGLKNIQYVIINVIMKESSGLVTKGYFVGIKPIVTKDFDVAKKSDLYVWLYRKGAVQMFNLDYYYIGEIQIGMGVNANMSSTQMFNDSDDRQSDAIKHLKNIVSALKKENIVKSNDLIDYKKYVNTPIGLKNDIEITQSKADTPNSHNRSSGVNYSVGHQPRVNTGTAGFVGTSYYSQASIETTQFKRTTKYNVAKAIKAMNEKINEIKNGTYKPPKLKRIPADMISNDESKETHAAKAASKAQQNWYDDEFGCYPYC